MRQSNGINLFTPFLLLAAVAVVWFGAYASIEWMLVGGIKEIVWAFNQHPIPSGPITGGIFKIIFCEAPFCISAFVGFILARTAFV